MECTLNAKSSVEEVFTWLNSNGFNDYSQSFSDEGIDGEVLSCLTERALETLVPRVGPRMKILKVIESLKHGHRSQHDIERYAACPSPSLSSISSSNGEASDSPSSSTCSSLPMSPVSHTSSTGRMKWQVPFPLPERFPPVVQEALLKESFLTKPVRSPTPDQRRDVCRAVIAKYRFLADAGGGYELWYRHLGDKIKNEMRNEKSDPIVLARKRKLTYSFRRTMVNTGKHMLKDIKLKYPFLFCESQINEEYNRLMADDKSAQFVSDNLLDLAPKIIKVAEKRSLSSPEAIELLALCSPSRDIEDDQELNAEDKAYVAICLLPHLMERKTKAVPNPESFLYQIADDPAEVASLTKPNMSPFLVVGGSVVEPTEFSIAGEQEVIMSISGGIIDAVGALMFVYYVCNLQYPKECFNTYFFLQRTILKVYDTQKVPTRVLMLMSELENC